MTAPAQPPDLLAAAKASVGWCLMCSGHGRYSKDGVSYNPCEVCVDLRAAIAAEEERRKAGLNSSAVEAWRAIAHDEADLQAIRRVAAAAVRCCDHDGPLLPDSLWVDINEAVAGLPSSLREELSRE